MNVSILFPGGQIQSLHVDASSTVQEVLQDVSVRLGIQEFGFALGLYLRTDGTAESARGLRKQRMPRALRSDEVLWDIAQQQTNSPSSVPKTTPTTHLVDLLKLPFCFFPSNPKHHPSSDPAAPPAPLTLRLRLRLFPPLSSLPATLLNLAYHQAVEAFPLQTPVLEDAVQLAALRLAAEDPLLQSRHTLAVIRDRIRELVCDSLVKKHGTTAVTQHVWTAYESALRSSSDPRPRRLSLLRLMRSLSFFGPTLFPVELEQYHMGRYPRPMLLAVTAASLDLFETPKRLPVLVLSIPLTDLFSLSLQNNLLSLAIVSSNSQALLTLSSQLAEADQIFDLIVDTVRYMPSKSVSDSVSRHM